MSGKSRAEAFLSLIYRSLGVLDVTDDNQVRALMKLDRHGSFLLTEAIRTLHVIPQQGYRRELYRDDDLAIPVIMAAASRELLFDLFLELVSELGGEVDVFVGMSHQQPRREAWRNEIDLPVLKSKLLGYEDLLLNDGCTELAVIDANSSEEVQLDEHKLLLVYSENFARFETIFQAHGVGFVPGLKFLTEGEHVHTTTNALRQQLGELLVDLGAEE